MKVLIADDDSVSRRLLQSYLEKWGHEAATAENGAEAWRLFEEGDFPLIISDWIMPEMDGLELIRRIRSSGRPGHIYAILLTAKSHQADIIEGMEAGADDFLIKPFDRNELRVRVRAGQRIIELEAALLASMKELAEARAREVAIGGKIQQTLLLGKPPGDFPGVALAVLTIPSEQIDGDFYDFFKHDGRCLDVVVGDVMGKGVAAALLAGAIKSQFLRALTVHSKGVECGNPPEPEQIVTAVHREVTGEFIGLEFFATLCYTRFNLEEGRVSFVDCGHTATVHFHHRTGECSKLKGENTPLGFSEGEVYRQASTPLEPGDVFFFYSDGVTEARNGTGEAFGEDRLIELVKKHGELSPDELIAEVRRAVLAFSQAESFADDLTCVSVKIEAAEPALLHDAIEIASQLKQLSRAREFVRGICGRISGPPMPEEGVADLELAVTEAASNIVKHAYHLGPDRTIHLQADVFADRIGVLLRHNGDPFEPEMATTPSFDGVRQSGFGVYIISQSVDEVRYFRDNQGWNCVSLVKKRTTL